MERHEDAVPPQVAGRLSAAHARAGAEIGEDIRWGLLAELASDIKPSEHFAAPDAAPDAAPEAAPELPTPEVHNVFSPFLFTE